VSKLSANFAAYTFLSANDIPKRQTENSHQKLRTTKQSVEPRGEKLSRFSPNFSSSQSKPTRSDGLHANIFLSEFPFPGAAIAHAEPGVLTILSSKAIKFFADLLTCGMNFYEFCEHRQS
jgi:hypothetical protein